MKVNPEWDVVFTVPAPHSPKAIVKRAFFLAYQACKVEFGNGVLQARRDATEEDVWHNVVNRSDYPGAQLPPETEPYGDYVFGRMMKLHVRYDDRLIAVPKGTASVSHQMWAGTYPSFANLFECAAASLGAALLPARQVNP